MHQHLRCSAAAIALQVADTDAACATVPGQKQQVSGAQHGTAVLADTSCALPASLAQEDWHQQFVCGPLDLHPQATPETLAQSRVTLQALARLNTASAAMRRAFQERHMQQQRSSDMQAEAAMRQQGSNSLVLSTLDPARPAARRSISQPLSPVALEAKSKSLPHMGSGEVSALPALSQKFAAEAEAKAAAKLEALAETPLLPQLPAEAEMPRQPSTIVRPGMRRSISESTGFMSWRQPEQAQALLSPFGASSFPSRAPLGQHVLGQHVLGSHSACSSFNSPSCALSSPFGSQTALTSRPPASPWLVSNPFQHAASPDSSCSSGGAGMRPATPAPCEGSAPSGIVFAPLGGGGGLLTPPPRDSPGSSCDCGSMAGDEDGHVVCMPQPGIGGVNLRKELHIGEAVLPPAVMAVVQSCPQDWSLALQCC